MCIHRCKYGYECVIYANINTHKYINIYTSVCLSNQKHSSSFAFLTTLNDIELDTESDPREMELE